MAVSLALLASVVAAVAAATPVSAGRSGRRVAFLASPQLGSRRRAALVRSVAAGEAGNATASAPAADTDATTHSAAADTPTLLKRGRNGRRRTFKLPNDGRDSLPYNVYVKPARTLLGTFKLDKNAGCGDLLEFGMRSYVIQRTECAYKWMSGNMVMVSKAVDVKDVGRIAQEASLARSLGKVSENEDGLARAPLEDDAPAAE